MRAEIALAQRAWQVRAAARSWHDAKRIDDAQLHAVEALYPDDRARVGPVFRIALFVATLVAVVAATGVLLILTEPRTTEGGALACMFMGALCLALTDWQTTNLRRAGGGTEAGTAFCTVALLIGAYVVIRDFPSGASAHLVAAVLFAAAAYRWGIRLFGLFAAAALFGGLAQLSMGRVAWAVTALAAAPILSTGSRSARLAPSHRRALEEALMVALTALYCAFNPYLLEKRFIESLRLGLDAIPIPYGRLAWTVSVAGAALVPIALIWLGVRSHPRPLFTRLGALFAVASLVTLRHYLAIAPVWATMTAGGILLLAGSIALRRWLDRGAGGERRGWTTERLLEDPRRQKLAEMALAAAIPHASAPQPTERGFRGEGGESGGGGATGTF